MLSVTSFMQRPIQNGRTVIGEFNEVVLKANTTKK